MKIIVGNIKSKIQIDGEIERKAIYKLREYLKVRSAGYRFSPAYKNKMWDGYRHFVSPLGVFATGFLPACYKYLKKEMEGVAIDIADTRKNLPYLQKNLDNSLPNGWEVRDYQMRMIENVNNREYGIYFPRGIIDASTNSGKNSIIAGIYNNLENPKLLFIIHSIEIFKQAVEFFSSLFKEDIGRVGCGYAEVNNFTIAMVKTLYNKASGSNTWRSHLNNFNCLIVDETHRAGGKEYSKLLQMVDAGMRVFVSGTPLNNTNKVNNMIIVGMSGEIIGKVTNDEMITSGYSLKPIVKVYLNPASTIHNTYTKELQEVVHYSKERAKIIGDICVNMDGKSVLITFVNIKHGLFLKKYIEEREDFFGSIDIVHGTIAGRSYKIEDFKKKKIDVLLTSIILKEGVNIPNIEVLILAQGGKSVITIKQFVGRALRTDGENTEVLIVDFYDKGKYVSKHSRERIRIYKKEQFKVIEQYKKEETKNSN